MFVAVVVGYSLPRWVVHIITDFVIIVAPGVHQAGGRRGVRQAVGLEDDDLLGPLASHAARHAGREGDRGGGDVGLSVRIRGRVTANWL